MPLLEPFNRLKLMEQFRPPDGYKLDRAIGTTFSLDLYSLLMAPLAMAMFEYDDKDEAFQDPMALLESLRGMADKIYIFCQKGRIAVPKNDSYLFSYLEPMVVEVVPDSEKGIFHPKVWLLRYMNQDDAIIYRFLCLSKNMTFDKSWDTVLTLDGEYQSERKLAYARNRPLSAFISALPGLGKNVSKPVKSAVRLLADEVLRADFLPPDSFDDLAFYPIGINGYSKGLDIMGYDRSLILSPFLHESVVSLISEPGKKNIIISREESFDALDSKVLSDLCQHLSLYTMEHSAEVSPADPENQNAGKDTRGEEDLSGLHAKLYILESGWDAHILTGSANATRPAFNAINVEFMTEIIGKKSRVGIDVLMGLEKDAPEVSLQKLLVPYKMPDEPVTVDDVRKKLEISIENARRKISRADLLVRITFGDDGHYHMELKAGKKADLNIDAAATCRPVMLSETYSLDISPLGSGSSVVFNNVTMQALTSFWVFEVTAEEKGIKLSASFILNLTVEGMPEGRNKFILQHLIANSEKFVRYLIFLLVEDPEEAYIGASSGHVSGTSNGMANYGGVNFPLLEELVRAYSRNPDKLSRVDSLVNDLKSSDDWEKILPPGFDGIWDAFKKVISKENGGQS